MYKTESNETPSEASSSLTEFVRRRYRGAVPVFGGNPSVGISELSTALMGSLQASGLIDAVKELRASVAKPTAATERSAPIEFVDDEKISPAAAANLDPAKVQMLLEASMVDSQDVGHYKKLLGIAQASIREKDASKRASIQRHQASQRLDSRATDAEIEHFTKLDDPSILARELGLGGQLGRDEDRDRAFFSMFKRSLVHDSLVNGRCTNRSLALIGDVAIKVMLLSWTDSHLISVGDSNAIWQATQNNATLRDVGVGANIAQYVSVGENLDPTARTIMATVIEAIYGTAYQVWGMSGVELLNEGPLCVCDKQQLGKKYDRSSSE